MRHVLCRLKVADRLGLTKGTVSRRLDRAVQAGLMNVQVSAHTRRGKSVTLTPSGTLPDLDPRDLAATLRVLGTLLPALER